MSFKPVILFCLVQFSFVLSSAQLNDSTFVVINPDGHMAAIKAMEFSPDGKLLYTVSDDKTVRVWDIRSKQLIQTYRGYIEKGNVGMFFSGALTNSGDYLAVAGYLGQAGTNSGEIRYISTYNGEVVYVFEGHSSTVVSLAVSADDKYMASGSSGGTIGIWSLTNGQGIRLSGHSDGVYGLAFSPSGDQLISVSYDSTVKVWDLKKILEEGKVEVDTLKEHTDKVRSVCYAPNGEFFITVGYDNRIIQYDSNGTFIKVIDEIVDPYSTMTGDLHTVSISEDSKTIVVGTRMLTDINAISYDVATGERLVEFAAHDNTVMASAFHGKNLVATAGGVNRDIYVWDAESGETIAHFAGKGQRIWEVAAGPGYQIGYSTKHNPDMKINNLGILNHVFDLSTLSGPIEHEDFSGFQEERKDTLDYTLTLLSQRKIAISSVDGNAYIELDPGVEGTINCFSLTPDQHVVVGSTFGLNLYDVKGNLLRSYRGHVNDVYSMAFSADGRYMYTGGGDQTIRVWDLSDKGKLRRTYEEFMDELRMVYGDSRIDELIESKGGSFFTELFANTEEPVVYPKASIFIMQDDEWIIWTDKMYYAASKGGSQKVGFQVNLGKDTIAKFYTFEQFDVQLNRPDKVLDILGIDNPSAKERYHLAYQKRLRKLGISESSFSSSLNAPELEVRTQNQTVYKSYFGLSHNMMDPDHGLVAEFVTVNGVPIYGTEGNPVGAMTNDTTTLSIVFNMMHTTLVPGMNKIQIWCTNTLGVQSNKETRYIYFDTVEVKPELYILGIGGSKYSKGDYNLKYAAKDVRDFVNTLSQSSQYAAVHVDTLINQDVTTDNIKEALARLNRSKVYDHVMIYFAGHGVLSEDLDYYLATYDMKFKKPEKNGLSYSYLENEIGRLTARTRTFFIDACHSGEVDKEEATVVRSDLSDNSVVSHTDRRGIEITSTEVEQDEIYELANDLFTDLRNNSGATIIASAGGGEYALEGPSWNNGVFTYAIINGLRTAEADLDKDGYIYLSELQKYVKQKVFDLTDGVQNPTDRVNNINNDHVIWKVSG